MQDLDETNYKLICYLAYYHHIYEQNDSNII